MSPEFHMSWIDNSVKNLLPLSNERVDFAAALHEWLYGGDMYDLEEPIETCELCEHPEIRYQFKIVNRHNGNELLVGSECINKFGIAATDDVGNILGRDDSRRRVNKDRRHLVTEARNKRQINSLVRLSGVEDNFNINSFISYVQDRGAFTPDQLSLLFWRFKNKNITYNPLDFKLTIRRNREKEQLKKMLEWKLCQLWPALSASQKFWVSENADFWSSTEFQRHVSPELLEKI